MRNRQWKILYVIVGLLVTTPSLQADHHGVDVVVKIESLVPENGVYFTPVWVGFHDGSFDLFDVGSLAGEPIERLAEDGDVSLLTTEPELTLIRKMMLLPELVEIAARTLEPHHLPYYAQDLATVFHSFYKQCRVVSQDEPLTKARLKLVAAAKIVLARTLHLMGMTAPEKM